MYDVKVDEALWASIMLPEGIVERWLIEDGHAVAAGQAIAEVRIEGALHDIQTPKAGRVNVVAGVNSVIEPGSVLATVAGE